MLLRKLILPLVAVTLGVTACGGDETPETGETPANGEQTDEPSTDSDAEDDEGAEADDSDEGGSEGGAEVDAVALYAAIADALLEAGSYEFENTTSTGGQEGTLAGAVEFATDTSEANMRMTMEMAGLGESTLLIVDGQFYIEMTEEMGIPGDASWFTVDPESDDPFSQQMASLFGEVGSATTLTDQLAEQADLLTVTEVGTETVDGVETTEYFVVVNDVAAFEGLPAAQASGDLSYTMWVGGDNLPRRMTTTVDGTAVIDMTFSNFGTDLDVEAPPAEDVMDLSEMMNQ